MQRVRTFRVPGLVSLVFVLILLLTPSVQAASLPAAKTSHRFPTVTLPAGGLKASLPSPSSAAASLPTLDSSVAAVATAAKTSKAKANDAAKQHGMVVSADQVQVYVTTRSGQAPSVTGAIRSAGGRVTKTDSGSTLVQAWLPVDKVEQVAAHPGVAKVARPDYAEPLDGAQTSEGVAASLANTWQGSGVNGAGVKVAVIDAGFVGYGALLGTDLPASVTVKNFVDGETDADGYIAATTEHGTACAEIVHDMAPGAQMYLVKVATSLDVQEAVSYLAGQGVKVISTSLGFLNSGPGNGTGAFTTAMSTAQSAGIFWATAAGNYREMHWGGAFKADAYGFHQWASNGDNINCFGPGDGSCYVIPAGYPLDVFLRWDDWTNHNQDYDLWIMRCENPASGWGQVGGSISPQNGQVGQTPTESASWYTVGADAVYGVMVKRINSTRNVNLEVYSPDVELDYQVASRSIASPADYQYPLSVAAVDVASSPYAQEPFSSEGPTNGPNGSATGGSVKPDITGYDGVSTVTYLSENPPAKFYGTSAATPHVAGAAALYLSANPTSTVDQVKSFLTGRAIDLGTAGKDNKYGYGRLNLGAPPPPMPPSIASFNPTSGPVGTSIAITGSNFQFTTSVAFNGAAADFAIDSPTQITARVPNSATTGPISVTSHYGTATSTQSYNVSSGTLPQLIFLPEPKRFVDTRSGTGKQGAGHPLQKNVASCFQIAGQGGVPSGTGAVILNLTAVGYTQNGWIAAYPSGESFADTSSLNFDTRENSVANFAIVQLGRDGKACLLASENTNAIVDVSGYAASILSSQLSLRIPTRLVDTRNGNGGRLQKDESRCFQVVSQPAGYQAAIVNLTAVGYTRDGWIAAYPSGVSFTGTSSLNFDTQENAIANFAIVPLGSDGKICLRASESTNAIIDVSGYVLNPTSNTQGNISFVPSPVRVVDTRPGSSYQGEGQPLRGTADPHSYLLAGQAGVPGDATAVIVNLTAVGYASNGWIAQYPSGGTFGGTSSVNYDTDENAIANFAIAKLGPDGKITLLGSSPTNAIVDVSGYLR